MGKLTEKKYWDSRHTEYSNNTPFQRRLAFKRLFHKLMPNAPWGESLGDRHRWIICDRHLPKNDKYRVVEIGCAPGTYLLGYSKRYGYEPWGIDYSHAGVMQTRKVFDSVGLNPEYIIEADFFSEQITERFRGFFDVVTSHGFIEHFDEPENVIKHHVSLLRPGGFLLVSIPNLRGFNYLRVRMAYPKKLAMHNLSIMRLSAFQSIFKNPEFGLEELFIGYFGTLTLRHVFPSWLPDFDSIIGKILWLIVGDRGFETSFFSPYLMYIGRRIL